MYPAPPTAPTRPRPVAGLGTAVIVLGVAVLAAYLLRLVASWLAYGAMFAEPAGDLSTLTQRLNTPLLLLLTSTFLLAPTIVAAAATTLVWVHRARANAGSLSPHLGLRYTPGSSVALLLIPFANLWFLGPVLADTCAGSSPYGPDPRGAGLVRSCWITTMVAVAVSVLGHLAFMVVNTRLYGTGRPVDDALNGWIATAGMAFATLEYVLGLGCAVLFALVVRHISRQQTALLAPTGPRW